MNCELVAMNVEEIRRGRLPDAQLRGLQKHIEHCPDCQDTVRGAEALAALRAQRTVEPPPGLLAEILEKVDEAPSSRRSGSRFWLGTGFGGAIAASFFALAIAVGWFSPSVGTNDPAAGIARFHVALGEPRNLDVAIEVDRALQAADVSILLSGGVELAGYGNRRELAWTTDLEAGVNRLTLPLIAVDQGGGQLIVRLSHPQTEKVFVVNLDAEA